MPTSASPARPGTSVAPCFLCAVDGKSWFPCALQTGLSEASHTRLRCWEWWVRARQVAPTLAEEGSESLRSRPVRHALSSQGTHSGEAASIHSPSQRMDRDEGQKPASADKGKGRASGQGGQGREVAGGGSLLTSIVQSVRSSVTPASLSSLATANGKTSQLPPSSHLPNEAFEAAHHPSVAPSSSHTPSRLPRAGPFHPSGENIQQAHDSAYRQFASASAGAPPLPALSSHGPTPPAVVGPYSSAQSLDAPLHDHVRATPWSDLDDLWTKASSDLSAEEVARLYDPGYHEAWARNIPAPTFDQRGADWAQGEHLDRLLQAVPSSDQMPRSTPTDLMALLDHEEAQEAVGAAGAHPATDAGGAMSDEQREMHSALNELQNSKQRADERVRPPDDDAAARTGVYAATPEQALQAVWDGGAEGERASALVQEERAGAASQDGGITRKIRQLLQRGSYVDDVYGLPPQLERTIVEAEEDESEENKERRAKAIRRLDALYRHLGAGPSSASIDDFVRDW